MRTIENETIADFGKQLLKNERARATAEKYVHDVRAFADWLADQELGRATVVEYKTTICEKYIAMSLHTGRFGGDSNIIRHYFIFVRNTRTCGFT